jgi:spermidine synthase
LSGTTPVADTTSSADNFHPARSGSGSLYTVEHFDAVKRCSANKACSANGCRCISSTSNTLVKHRAQLLSRYPGAHAMLATNSLETPVLGPWRWAAVSIWPGCRAARDHDAAPAPADSRSR